MSKPRVSQQRASRRGALGATVSGILALLLVTAAVAAQGTTPPVAPAAQGDFAGLVDIGGRRLYLDCQGTGSPTVMLEAGGTARGDFWTRDFHEPAGRRSDQSGHEAFDETGAARRDVERGFQLRVAARTDDFAVDLIVRIAQRLLARRAGGVLGPIEFRTLKLQAAGLSHGNLGRELYQSRRLQGGGIWGSRYKACRKPS